MNTTRGVTFLARPELLVAASITGLILTVVLSVVFVVGGERGVLQSLLIGLGVGLPSVLYVKWGMSRHVEFYARFLTLPLSERLTWPIQKKNWLYQWPSFLAIPLVACIAARLDVIPVPGFMIVLALTILLYPEQKAVYEAAKARLKEAECP